MINVLKNLVLRYCPRAMLPFVNRFYWRFVGLNALRRYYERVGANEEIEYLLKRIYEKGSKIFLYPWAEEKRIDDVEVFFDDATQLPYVLLDGKRLFFPRTWNVRRIKEAFHALQHIEQHELSPHRYLSKDFDVCADDCVADCGAAEGNFSLSVVERVKRVYLFEADETWMEALNATFAPWKEKVEIIQKYVSDEDTTTAVRLDTFFADKTPPTFLKMDVEGFEKKVLQGAGGLLASSVGKVAACAYHYAKDEIELTDFMREAGFSVAPSSGYMFFNLYDDEQPYFRRGLLRCSRQT